MSPTPAPNSAYIKPYPISGNVRTVTVAPTGVDDYDNLQYALNQLAGKSGAVLKLLNGPYYTRYMLQCLSPLLTIDAAPGAVLYAGRYNERMAWLDATDRATYNPSGYPYLMVARPDAVSGYGSLTVNNLVFSGSLAPGWKGTLWGNNNINLGVRAGLALETLYPNLQKVDIPVTLTGTTPASIGNANPINLYVFEGPHGTGREMINGVDYSQNVGAGTITRIPSGHIASGQQLYCTYSNAKNCLNVARLDCKLNNVTFRAVVRNGPSGFAHINMDQGLRAVGSYGYVIGTNNTDIYDNACNTEDSNFAALNYSEGGYQGFETPWQPWNGDIQLNACTFENIDVPVWIRNQEGLPASAGSYVFMPQCLSTSRFVANGDTFNNCGQDVNAPGTNGCYLIETASACDVSMANFKATNCISAFVMRVGQSFWGQRRLAGWVGKPSNWTATQFTALIGRRVNSPPFVVAGEFSDLATGNETDASINVSNFTLEILQKVQQQQQAVGAFVGPRVTRLLKGDISFGKFINASADTVPAIDAISQTFTIRGCDFSRYLKQNQAVDVDLGPLTTGATLMLTNQSDLYRNQGTGNIIVGGTPSA